MATFNGFGEKAIPFLKALNFHQSREWFIDNKPLFESDLREPLGDLIEALTQRFGEAGLGLKGDRRKSQFRINRDVRFSKDKRPYTDHVSAILSPDGSKTEQGVFFVHIGLDRCFAAVAWWGAGPELLKALREAIVQRPAEFRRMVAALRRNRLQLDPQGSLKRMPRGFDKEAEEDFAAALRYRHFVVRHAIDPAGIHSPALLDELVDFTIRARPLLDWGRKVEGRVVPSKTTRA